MISKKVVNSCAEPDALPNAELDSDPCSSSGVRSITVTDYTQFIRNAAKEFPGPPIDWTWVVPVVDVDFSANIVKRVLRERQEAERCRNEIEQRKEAMEQLLTQRRHDLEKLEAEYSQRRVQLLAAYQRKEQYIAGEINQMQSFIASIEDVHG